MASRWSRKRPLRARHDQPDEIYVQFRPRGGERPAGGVAPLLAALLRLGSPVTWLEVGRVRVSSRWWSATSESIRRLATRHRRSLLYFCVLESRLYGDAEPAGVLRDHRSWGWWQWLRGTSIGAAHAGRPSRCSGPSRRARRDCHSPGRRRRSSCALHRHRRAVVDAFPTADSVVGQWLLGRKYVENWPVWIVVDVVGRRVRVKGLWLTARLYVVFVVLQFRLAQLAVTRTRAACAMSDSASSSPARRREHGKTTLAAGSARARARGCGRASWLRHCASSATPMRERRARTSSPRSHGNRASASTPRQRAMRSSSDTSA